MVYTIGNLEFNTKQSAEDYTRNIINTIGIDNIYKNHEQYEFFKNLLENHHSKERKIGCGIDYFIISKNARKTGLEIRICRIDGSIEPFSWKDCAKKQHSTNKQLLSNAMRYAIEYQIRDFRNNNTEICSNPVCNKEVKCDVDHKNPTFAELKTSFIEQNSNVPTDFDKDSITNQHKFKNTDNKFEKLWQQYHKQYAVLQYLCTSCHKTKTNAL